MFSLFLSLPGSDGCGHRRLPPTLGWASGLRFSSVVCHSTGAGETPCVPGDGAHSDSSVLASASVVSRPPSPVAGPSGCSASSSRPPAPASVSLPLPGSPQVSPSCLETLRRFTRAAGFSSSVASQASLLRRPSSRTAYQFKWQVYRAWCHSHGHSVSRPSLAKVADFLCWLRSSKNLGVSSIKGYRSMLSAVFRFQLPSLFTHPVLRDLLRSFCLESVERQLRPPAWDLSLVLRYLNTSAFEPLSVAPLCALTQKVLFLLALATAKRCWRIAGSCLLWSPLFMVMPVFLMSLSLWPGRSRSPVPSLAPSWFHSCPILRLVLMTTSCSALFGLSASIWTGLLLWLLFAIVSSCLLVAPHAVSFFLRDVISSARASRPEVGLDRAHDVCSVSTSVAFHRNWSVSAVLESATWSSSSVFSSFYLRDLQHEYDGILSLGPFVAAGTRIG